MKTYTEQLPSGNWRSKVIYTDQNGKKRSKSFTADTRVNSVMHATAYFEKQENQNNPYDKTIRELISAYIKSRKGVVSEETISRYGLIYFKMLKNIGKVQAKDLTQPMYQDVIKQYAKGRKVKMVMEAHSLFTRALKYSDIDIGFIDKEIKLPKSPNRTIPTKEELIAILKESKKKDIYLPVLLALTMALRRTEIFALSWDCIDLENKKLLITRNNNEYSLDIMPMVEEAFKEKQGKELLFDYSIEAFDSRLKRVMAKLDLTHNYHSLIRFAKTFFVEPDNYDE